LNRIVILTGDAPEHRYVANRLCRSVAIEGVVVDTAVRGRSLRRAFRGGVRRGLSRLALEAFRRTVHDGARRRAALARVLGKELTAGFEAEDRVVPVRGVNSAEAVAVMSRLRPDLILVYGTSIVRDELLSRAGDLVMNMHTGLSPDYRGTDCAFWPIVNGEPERIGATVHECTDRVDGGQIYAVATAGWVPDDGLHELFARAVACGAELYVDAARRYCAGTLAGRPQDLATGREYRGFMRTLGPELRARWALRRGLLRRSPAQVPELSRAVSG
jgi:methionyl-tRNA formyltransferase